MDFEKFLIEALVKCQHQASLYVTYFLLWRLDLIYGLALSIKGIFTQDTIWIYFVEILFVWLH